MDEGIQNSNKILNVFIVKAYMIHLDATNFSVIYSDETDTSAEM